MRESPDHPQTRTHAGYIGEPANCRTAHTLEGPGSGQYAKPFVIDDGEFLQLHFSMRYTQSRMSHDAPDTLTLAYTRAMMCFLLFQAAPKRVVIIGLGGGSLTKFCYRQLPHTQVTTVEIDQNVIDMAPLFHVPGPDERMHIVHADAADYFATTRQSADVVLLDGCDQHGMAPAFHDEAFYASLRARLRPGGMLVANLVGTKERSDPVPGLIAEAFDDQLLLLSLASGGNRIAFAFCDPAWPPDWEAIKPRAAKLTKQYPIDFVGFARLLERKQHPRSVPKRSRPVR